MGLDSKGSVDVAVGVNPEPKGSEDELKGSAPPSFMNGPEAGVDALDADDLNPAKGSARLAGGKGSELGKASALVEKEEEALEDEVNEPNTSWSVEALEPLDVADGGALGLGSDSWQTAGNFRFCFRFPRLSAFVQTDRGSETENSR